MSIATEIFRLQKAKADLKSSIRNKGVTVDDSALISTYAGLVDSIPSGGQTSFKTGTFTVTTDTQFVTIEHGLGKMPTYVYYKVKNYSDLPTPSINFYNIWNGGIVNEFSFDIRRLTTGANSSGFATGNSRIGQNITENTISLGVIDGSARWKFASGVEYEWYVF